MACGVCLGIVLICLIQAEHVGSLRASRGESSDMLRYVGFSQHDGRLRRLDDSFPQNGLRQASASPRSSYRQVAASGAASPGLSSAANTETVQTRSARLFPRPTQQAAGREVKAPAPPKKKFQLSTAVASGSSVSKTSRRKNKPTGDVQRRPAVQGSPQMAQRLPLAPPSALKSREGYSFRPAQNPPPAASKGPLWTGFAPVQAQTSVSIPGRRVSLQYRPPGLAAAGGYGSKAAYRHPGQSSGPSYSYLLQRPTSGARNVPGSGGTRHFAPTTNHGIPKRFGGAVIRRLSSSNKPKPSVAKPQQTPAAPQRRMPHKQVSRFHGDRKLAKSRLF